MIASRAAGGAEYFNQLDRLGLQLVHARRNDESGALGDFYPQIRFIGFLQNGGDLADEVSLGFAALRRAVIGRHRTTVARDLSRNGSSRRLARKCIGKLEHADGKLDGSFFEFNRGHNAAKVPNLEAIINHKS